MNTLGAMAEIDFNPYMHDRMTYQPNKDLVPVAPLRAASGVEALMDEIVENVLPWPVQPASKSLAIPAAGCFGGGPCCRCKTGFARWQFLAAAGVSRIARAQERSRRDRGVT